MFERRVQKEIARINLVKSRTYSTGDRFKFEIKDFNWLIEKLCGHPEKRFYGCHLNIAETVIIKDGKIL